MAKGKINSPILGVALGVSLSDVSSGPFAQFQNCSDDENSLTNLIKQLVNKIPNSEPDEDVIRFQVLQFKTKIEKIINDRKENKVAIAPTKNTSDADASAKLFEEVKIMFKELPARLERASFKNPQRENRRIHPMMIEELAHFSMKVDPKIS